MEDGEESAAACGGGEEAQLCRWLPAALAHSEGGGRREKERREGRE